MASVMGVDTTVLLVAPLPMLPINVLSFCHSSAYTCALESFTLPFATTLRQVLNVASFVHASTVPLPVILSDALLTACAYALVPLKESAPPAFPAVHVAL